MGAPLVNPDLASMQLKAEIGHSEASSIFWIELQGSSYALKVVGVLDLHKRSFHDNGDPGVTKNGRDLNRFRNEVNAYKNLDAFGVCDSGLVPKYYGSIDRLNPSSYEPWLNGFVDDKFHPNAILLEYLPDPEPLNCVNYSKERHSKAMEALAQVHNALVVHNDIYPKNILIVPGCPERVVLIDFDVAKTFPTKELMDEELGIQSPRPIKAAEYEFGILGGFGKALEEDQKEGLPPNTSFY
ncbi:hypothetical protein NUU61_002226 [Penicillium alfredii]|uniref:Protein kinase domain-containing protein n=1 Tax=Penicillium alfredii TaxID=1506179 RepID=A0A9W9KFS6_9EURO|nr:uncharacterized protein NUU61_002226 [Penicillium alfredii]KAJ5104879.1 hypothetical protein NUU61_002226 [Penicillium alfredii]